MKKFRKYFFQGLLFLAPVGLTVYIIYLIYIGTHNFLENQIKSLLPFDIPFLNLIIFITIILLVTLIGLLGQTFIFRPVQIIIGKAFEKVPIIKFIYTALKDFISAFVGKDKKFTNPALVKVHHLTNLEKIGFITKEDLSAIGIRDKKVAVYFPHSYNFSGELFIVPADQVTPLDLPAAEVMKFIVSGGVLELEATEKLSE